MRFLNGLTADVLVLRSGTCRVWRARSLTGLQLTSVKPKLSRRRRSRRILMNAHLSPGQGNLPSC